MSANPHPNLSGPLRTLNRALRQELLLGRKLAAIADAQTEALVNNDAVRIGALAAEGRAIVDQQAATAQRRIDAARALAAEIGLEARPDLSVPPLSQIALCLPLDEARKLIALRAEILDVEQEIQAINTRNRPLLQNALEFVQVSLYALTSLALRPARYGTNPDAVAAPTFYVDEKC